MHPTIPSADATAGLARVLGAEVEGEVRFDRTSRLLYSTDASLYQIEPAGVVLPRHRGDVQTVVRRAGEHGVPIIPRGGGTGLAGQTVGCGVVLDFSKYCHSVLELDAGAGRVRVEPGVVLDELNRGLAGQGLQFAPDVATSAQATIGGMVANNSAGAHSIVYGKTIDHVLELEVVLADGSEAVLRDLDGPGLARAVGGGGLAGRAHAEVARLADLHREEIDARYPKILRRVGGYNLDVFVGAGTAGRPFNLSRVVVGSEGTLACVVGAVLKVVPLPSARGLLAVHFTDLFAALEAVAPILDTSPAAVELIDKMILDQTRGASAFARQRRWVEGDPVAVLVVEYFGEDAGEVAARVEALGRRLASDGLGYAHRPLLGAAEQADVWAVRKAGLGLLMSAPGDARPVSFVEDAAVSPEKLPAFIREFDGVVREHGTTASFYAHASVGLLHVRPLLDLKTAEGVGQMRSIAGRVRDLVLRYGGAMSGEHGDGLARSCWNEELFGSQLYGAFREVKAAFDPENLFNPGKIVDAPAMTENLRTGPAYRVEEPPAGLDFSADGGIARAVERCTGVGTCRKLGGGAMCPSYRATHEEEHSTRGRANALRAALDGRWPDGFSDPRMHAVLDLCLACKACKTECPSGVDLAKLKYVFLDRYYRGHRRPALTWLTGNYDRLARAGALLPGLANALASGAAGRWLLRRAGVAPGRSLPPFAPERFSRWFARRRPGAGGPNSVGGGSAGRPVALFLDTYTEYHCPEIGVAAVRVLEAAGYTVALPPRRCCGRPMLSAGMLERARANARFNLAQLFPIAAAGVPIVGLEPSCLSMLVDELPDLIPAPEARAVAAAAGTVEDLLARGAAVGGAGGGIAPAWSGAVERAILLHGHCHQEALWGSAGSLAALNQPPGFHASRIDAGCCGMAGAFGYEADHYEVSVKIGEERLAPAVRAAPAETLIAAPGISCRQQIEHLTGRRARHPVELLAEGLEAKGR